MAVWIWHINLLNWCWLCSVIRMKQHLIVLNFIIEFKIISWFIHPHVICVSGLRNSNRRSINWWVDAAILCAFVFVYVFVYEYMCVWVFIYWVCGMINAYFSWFRCFHVEHHQHQFSWTVSCEWVSWFRWICYINVMNIILI